jgi:hypothetical protein
VLCVCMRECACVCVFECICERERVSMCLCMCTCDGERERVDIHNEKHMLTPMTNMGSSAQVASGTLTHTRHTYTWSVKRGDEESRARGSFHRTLRASVFECVRKRERVCV